MAWEICLAMPSEKVFTVNLRTCTLELTRGSFKKLVKAHKSRTCQKLWKFFPLKPVEWRRELNGRERLCLRLLQSYSGERKASHLNACDCQSEDIKVPHVPPSRRLSSVASVLVKMSHQRLDITSGPFWFGHCNYPDLLLSHITNIDPPIQSSPL